jgi:hypothetical protein
MVLRFLTSYRSRAQCARFAAGAVMTTDDAGLIREVFAAGVAEDVTPQPEPEPEAVTDEDPVFDAD